MSAPSEFSPVSVAETPVVHVAGQAGLGNCDCGGSTFVFVNELKMDKTSGIRASRMYECTCCNTYRLGR